MLILCISPGCCNETTKQRPLCKPCIASLQPPDRQLPDEKYHVWIDRIHARYNLPPPQKRTRSRKR